MRKAKIEAIREFIHSGEYSAPPGTELFERELKDWCDHRGYVVQGFGRRIQANNDSSSAEFTRKLISRDRELQAISRSQGWDNPGYDDMSDEPYDPLDTMTYDFSGAFGSGQKNWRGNPNSRRWSGGGGGDALPRFSGATVVIVLCLAAAVYFFRDRILGLLGGLLSGLLPILVMGALVLGVIKIIPRLIRKEIQPQVILLAVALFIVGFNGQVVNVPPLARAGCIIVALLLLMFT